VSDVRCSRCPNLKLFHPFRPNFLCVVICPGNAADSEKAAVIFYSEKDGKKRKMNARKGASVMLPAFCSLHSYSVCVSDKRSQSAKLTIL
jgi:hypothetical protein